MKNMSTDGKEPLLTRADPTTYGTVNGQNVDHGNESLLPKTQIQEKDINIKVYKRRWYVLTVFGFMSMTQCAVWNTFSPISEVGERVFGWNTAGLSLLTNWGPIAYLLGTFGFSWILDEKGLRPACVVSGFLVLAGTGLRCITSKSSIATPLIHFGQFLNGLAGPIAMGAPPALSAEWFPPEQRTTATALATISNTLGLAVSFLLGEKRKPSRSKSRSSSIKKQRDSSPAVSTHSKKSSKEPTADREKDRHSDKGSVAGSEKSRGKTDSVRSKSRRSRKDDDKRSDKENKRSRKGSDEDTERKRSTSRSKDGSDGSSKRRKIDSYPEDLVLDSLGDNNLENIEQNFSDWSDNDSDDDILNRPGQLPSKKEKTNSASVGKRSPSPQGSVGSQHSHKAKSKDNRTEEEKSRKTSEQEEDPGELESISSDEGSLVEQVTQAAVDALEIDWASMMKDDRPKLSTGSALNRFKPGALFTQMGVSQQFAGEELYKEVLEVCLRHQEEELGS